MEQITFLGIVYLVVGVFYLLGFLGIVMDVWKIRGVLLSEYTCKTCGFKSKQNFDFCPVCGKDENGKTLDNLIEAYKNQKNES